MLKNGKIPVCLDAYSDEEDFDIFNNALKTATAEITSEGELIFYDIEGAVQDTKNDTFTMSLNELVRFYFALKQKFRK